MFIPENPVPAQVFTLSDSILSKTARGAGWTIGWRMSTRILGVMSTLILARLLVPADFGLVALATGFAQGLLALSTLGIDEAVIRHPAATREVYDTAFTINLIRGLATALLVAGCAWPAAAFFNEPRLVPILLVLAACSLITAFENIGTIEFRRDFLFHQEFRLLVAPRLAAIAVTITVALLWRTHWALVAGVATGQILGTGMGYVMHPYRPRLGLSAWRQLAAFSFWSWAISMAIIVRDRVDSFVIGRSLGLTQVGVYTVAGEIALMPTHELASPLSRACFSGFAAATRAGADTALVCLRILGSMSFVMLPVAAGISLVAAPAVILAFGPAWAEAIVPVRILGWVGAALVLGTVTSTLLSAHGLLRPALVINLLAMAVRIAAALALVGPYGLTGVAVAHALTILLENVAYATVTFRHFGIRGMDFLARTWRAVLATLLMAAVLTMNQLGVDTASPGLALCAAVSVGAGVYTGAVLVLWRVCGRPEGAEADLLEMARRTLAGLGSKMRWLTRSRSGVSP